MALVMIKHILGSGGRALTHSLSNPEYEILQTVRFVSLDSHDLATTEHLYYREMCDSLFHTDQRLTNKEALTVLCSVVKHLGSG